jgi:hypothetical protein
VQALAKTIELLQNSVDSLYVHMSVAAVSAVLQIIQGQFEQTGELDKTRLRLLFAPTGSLQEIAIDNGWGAEFLLLAAEMDKIIQ